MKIILIIASVTMFGVPRIETHDMPDMKTCQTTAKQVFNKVKVSSARVWCNKVIEKRLN